MNIVTTWSRPILRNLRSVANLTVWLIAMACLTALNGQVFAQTSFERLGPGPEGKPAFSYIGVVKQNGETFTTFGYLTHLNGLPNELLFFDAGERDHRNARFTFYSRTKMTSKSVLNKVFSLGVEGQLNLYLRSTPVEDADTSQVRGFQAGTQVASMRIRGQSVVAVTTPNSGINSATLQLTQTPNVWGGFSIEDRGFTFGRPGSQMQMTHIGRGEKTQDAPVIASITIAGAATTVAVSEEQTP